MRKVLVVVDMQNDFTTGPLGNEECASVVPRVVERIKSDEYHNIIVTQDTHYSNYLETQEGKKLPVVHCIRDTDGWKLCQPVEDALQSMCKRTVVTIIDKFSFGSLYLGKLLEETYFLDDKDIRIDFVGVCTGICVISNALIAKAALPEAQVRVLSDACACTTPESHKRALEAMQMCQIEVV